MLNNKPWYHKDVDFKLLDTCSKILYGIGEPEECGGSEVREESMWVPDTPHTAVLTFALYCLSEHPRCRHASSHLIMKEKEETVASGIENARSSPAHSLLGSSLALPTQFIRSRSPKKLLKAGKVV